MDKFFRRRTIGRKLAAVVVCGGLWGALSLLSWHALARPAAHLSESLAQDNGALLVERFRYVGSNIPVVCDGVEVHSADIVVADNDGVVVVPRAQAKAVIDLAEQLDFKEHSMYGAIEKFKSILKAVEQFGRI